MSIKIVFLFVAFASLFACSDIKEVKSDCNLNLEVNETEIYSIIAKYWLENSNKFDGKTIVILNKTHSLKDDHPNISLENRSKPSIFDIDAVEDFQKKNQKSVLLNNVLKLSNEYQYLSPENKFYKENLAKDFVNAYPNAVLLIGFSRIGFNKDYSKALVYSFNLFDRGSYFELKSQNCGWKIKQESPLWNH